jgi:hypothetical protein
MEKFEFLPIKCRMQRARQMYHKYNSPDERHAMQEGKKPLKSKVGV